MPARRPRRLLALCALVAVVAGGCSSDGSDGGAAPATTAAASTSAAAPTPTTTTVPTTTTPPTTTTRPTGCTTPGPTAPAGATSRPIIDVDGDGRADTGWIASDGTGRVTFGITTAAGGSTSTDFPSASPVRRSVLVANADEQGPVELLFDDGRSVGLHAFVDCAIRPVTDPEGGTYTFGLGFTEVGTGVGCIDTPDGRRLAGLDVVGDESGDAVRWTSTVVELDGTTARNGATDDGILTRPEEDADIELLHEVTCGDATIDDAVSLPS